MGADPGRRKKAQERRRKRQQRDEHRQAALREELRSLAGRLERDGRGPLHACRLDQQRRGGHLAHVLIAREGRGGITMALLEVDLGCLGVKKCLVREGLTPGEYDDVFESLQENLELERCSPARALKLIATAVQYASKLGFRPHADFAAVRALFGDTDPATCPEEFVCGAEGKPYYDPGPDDDVRLVLTKLEERLGPQGFQYLLLPGEVEYSKELPGDEHPDPAVRAWGRLRRAEGWLTTALMKTAAVHFGKRFFERALDEFAPDHERDEVEDGVQGVLDSWALSRRIPGFRPLGRPAREEEERSAVEILLEENGARLPEFERRVLDAFEERPFSFYVVRSVTPGEGMGLRDVFTGDEYAVHERSLSMQVAEGVVLYARIIPIDGTAILVGCGSYVLPPSFRFELLERRTGLEEYLGPDLLPLTERWLRLLEGSLRVKFCEIASRIRFPPPPQMSNTDGEALLFHSVHYELGCSPRAALEALQELAFEWNDEDFVQESKLDPSGALAAIDFSWQGRGNKSHPSWTNTTLGRIELDGRRMKIEVNSAERAERIQHEVERRLGERARLQRIEQKTLEQMRAEQEKAPKEPAQSGPSGSEREPVAPDPAMLRAMAEAHWKSWYDHPIPALGDVSPREAARTPAGRELLDVLLDDFAFRSSDRDDPLKPDVAALRRELGLVAPAVAL